MSKTTHEILDCGLELGTCELPDRHAVHLDLRIHAGTSDDPQEKLGAAYLVQETITKGTAQRDGRALSDAFDAIGAAHSSWTGRESTGFSATCLPEFLDRTLELHAEFLTTPSFPEDACTVAVELARQEITSLKDDPRELCDKILARQAYGPRLGRHPLGEEETLERITRDDLASYWRQYFCSGRMQLVAAGPIEFEQVRDKVEALFADFGERERAGREPVELQFDPRITHHQQEAEQEQIGICFPGVSVRSEAYPVQKVLLSVLSGGMSSRLFTEVREKLGLVYYVSAWSEHPREHGMIHLAASTTPERCGETYRTLLREVNRLTEDLTEDELERARTGIIARVQTRGDLTSARCSELSEDLVHFGKPVPIEEKLQRIRGVSVEGVKQYLHDHPRDRLSVVTLGPGKLEA